MNAGDRAAMTPLARRVARAIADSCRERLGSSLHSVYLTGAATRGRTGPIRAFAVLRMTSSTVGLSWLEETASAVRARWPGVGQPELKLYAWREVFPAADAFSPARFQLGVNSVCLVGRDLARLVAPQRLNVSAANSWIVQVRERVTGALSRIDLASNESEVALVSSEIGRYLLAAGFALVMPHEGVYTEDPDLQRDFIALNFPERAEEVELAYQFITEPTRSAVELIHLIDSFGAWLSLQCDEWLDRHNPQRLTALPA